MYFHPDALDHMDCENVIRLGNGQSKAKLLDFYERASRRLKRWSSQEEVKQNVMALMRLHQRELGGEMVEDHWIITKWLA